MERESSGYAWMKTFGSIQLILFLFPPPPSDDARFYSIATRDDDAFLSSLVNSVVLATIYALENGIVKERSEEMPLSSIFGDDLGWALRDAVAYSGGYAELYEKNFGSSIAETGRNSLNNNGPRIHSFPGLYP